MKKILIFTDGSYADGQGGFSFLLLFPDIQFMQILGYGREVVESPVTTELLAVKRALEYIIYQGYHLIYKIEIRCDVEGIVSLLNNKVFKEYLKTGLLNTHKKIIKNNFNMINDILSLLKLIPMANFDFTHVKSKKNSFNIIVDIWAGYARKSFSLNLNSLYISKRESEIEMFKKLEVIQNIDVTSDKPIVITR